MRHSHSGIRFIEGAPILKDLGIDLVPPPYRGKFPCSFCGIDIGEESKVTRGTGQLRWSITQEPVFHPSTGAVIDFVEKKTCTSSDLMACPACCLKLVPRSVKNHDGTPKLNAKGDPIFTGDSTKFAPFD